MSRLRAYIILFILFLLAILIVTNTTKNWLGIFKRQSSPVPQQEITTEEQVVEQKMLDEAEAIRTSMSEYLDQPFEDFAMILTDIEDNFATGTVEIRASDQVDSFLATNIGDEWIIIHLGEDPVSCETTDTFNIPQSIVPSCQ